MSPSEQLVKQLVYWELINSSLCNCVLICVKGKRTKKAMEVVSPK